VRNIEIKFIQNRHIECCPTKRALDAGDSVASQTVSYAFSFFWLDGFAVPTPAQVTQTVGRLCPLLNSSITQMEKK
jgi:hypothetical protein